MPRKPIGDRPMTDADLDLDELAVVEPPRGYGRD
jgi:hypothetical protein